MKRLIINNLPDWKIDPKVKEWRFYLTNVGGDIFRNECNLIIVWENDNKPTVVHHILDVCNDILGDEWMIEQSLYDEVKYLHNDFTIIFDNMNGQLEVR